MRASTHARTYARACVPCCGHKFRPMFSKTQQFDKNSRQSLGPYQLKITQNYHNHTISILNKAFLSFLILWAQATKRTKSLPRIFPLIHRVCCVNSKKAATAPNPAPPSPSPHPTPTPSSRRPANQRLTRAFFVPSAQKRR